MQRFRPFYFFLYYNARADFGPDTSANRIPFRKQLITHLARERHGLPLRHSMHYLDRTAQFVGLDYQRRLFGQRAEAGARLEIELRSVATQLSVAVLDRSQARARLPSHLIPHLA